MDIILLKLLLSLVSLFCIFIYIGKHFSPKKYKNAFVLGATICLYGLLALYSLFGLFIIFGKLNHKDLTNKIKKAIDKPI